MPLGPFSHSPPKKSSSLSGCSRTSFKPFPASQVSSRLSWIPNPPACPFWSLLSASKADQFGCPDLNPFSSFPSLSCLWHQAEGEPNQVFSPRKDRIALSFSFLSNSSGILTYLSDTIRIYVHVNELSCMHACSFSICKVRMLVLALSECFKAGLIIADLGSKQTLRSVVDNNSLRGCEDILKPFKSLLSKVF